MGILMKSNPSAEADRLSGMAGPHTQEPGLSRSEGQKKYTTNTNKRQGEKDSKREVTYEIMQRL